MTFDAIVADMDIVWEKREDARSAAEPERSSALKRLLEGARADGYPVMLVSELNAERLNAAITEMLGEDGVNYFTSILASRELVKRYSIALHTLSTPAHRVVALADDERQMNAARASGITHCVALTEALKRGFIPAGFAAIHE